MFADWELDLNGEEPFRIALLQYGEAMKVLVDVLKVTVLSEYRLALEFENKQRRLINMNAYIKTWKKLFVTLKGSSIFKCASVDYGAVVWPGNIDMPRKPSTTNRFR